MTSIRLQAAKPVRSLDFATISGTTCQRKRAVLSPESVTVIGIAVVQWTDKYLVGVRPAGAVLAGFDEFPGGKCRPLESPTDCALRECLEETGLAVRVEKLLVRKQHTYEHGKLDLHFLLCHPEAGQPPQPSGNFEWVPATELHERRFPSANAEAVRMLIEAGRVDP